MSCCRSCENFDGSNNPFMAGFCEIRQVPVMPGTSAEDCPYYCDGSDYEDDDNYNDYEW
ncbi:MAG: hypothetical protein K2K91_10885 [Ruminococcus sp.]|nr:hypothetical protein [Ruminococcus sp.]